MAGVSLHEQGYKSGLWRRSRLVGIKAPVFSMSKLIGVDNYLGPEMKSTGEVMGLDFEFEGALTKALIASGLMLPPQGGLLLSVADRDKTEFVPLVKRLHELGYVMYATEGTASMIAALGMPVKMVTKKLSEGHPNVIDIIRDHSVQAVVNTITGGRLALKDGFAIRRAAVERRIPCYTSPDTVRIALEAVANAGHAYNVERLETYVNGRP